MYARVMRGTAKPGKLNDCIAVGDDLISPAVRKYAGFRYWISLVDPETEHFMSIALWEDETDMNTFAQQDIPGIFGQMRDLMNLDTMETEMYEVGVFTEALPVADV